MAMQEVEVGTEENIVTERGDIAPQTASSRGMIKDEKKVKGDGWGLPSENT